MDQSDFDSDRLLDLFDDVRLLINAGKKNLEQIKSIVELEKLSNVADSVPNTLLHIATFRNNYEVVHYLIEAGCEINARNVHGETPLMIAILNEYKFIVKLLIKSGANFDVRDNQGRRALQIIGQKDWMNNDILRIILEKLLSEFNREDLAKKFIAVKWPLPVIIGLEDAKLTEIILNSGYKTKINFDVANFGGCQQKALHVAVKHFDVENVKLLLEYKAKVNVLDAVNRTPLWYLYGFDTKHSIEKIEILRMLLEETRSEDSDFEQVKWILKYGNKEAIKLLFQSKLNWFIIDSGSQSVVHMLVKNNNFGVFENVQSQGIDMNALDIHNRTPLMVAAGSGNYNAVEALLNKGAKIDFINKYGYTAMTFATKCIPALKERCKKCVQALLEHRIMCKKEIFEDDVLSTLNNNFRVYENYLFNCELVLAYVAVQEARGAIVSQSIRIKVESNGHFKTFFQSSKQQLNIKVNQSITLFDLLAATENKLERYICKKEIAIKLTDFMSTYSSNYLFSKLLQKRLEKTIKTHTLRPEAGRTICILMGTDYNRFPLIADNIISYMDLQTMINLIKAVV